MVTSWARQSISTHVPHLKLPIQLVTEECPCLVQMSWSPVQKNRLFWDLQLLSLLEQNLPSCEMTQMLARAQKSAEEEARKLQCQQPSLCRLIRASLSSLWVPDMTQAETGAITQPLVHC